MYIDMKFSFEKAIDVCKNIHICMYLYCAVINKWSNKKMRYEFGIHYELLSLEFIYVKKSLNNLKSFFYYKTF